jgi:hypothetical protein
MQRQWIGRSEGCEFKMERWSEDKSEDYQKIHNEEKNRDCISKGVGRNCPAKSLLNDSISQSMLKVKKKSLFLSKEDYKNYKINS